MIEFDQIDSVQRYGSGLHRLDLGQKLPTM